MSFMSVATLLCSDLVYMCGVAYFLSAVLNDKRARQSQCAFRAGSEKQGVVVCESVVPG